MSTAGPERSGEAAPADDVSDDGRSAGPDEPDLDDDRHLLAERLWFQSKRQRRDLRRLPALLLTSVALVWRTNRRATATTVALQLSGALVAAVQVFLAAYAVRLLLRTGDDITTDLLVPLLLLAVVTLVGNLSATAGNLMGRLLSVQVERRITDEVLDVATRVPLVDYEDPVFYNHLSRVVSNVPLQPFQVVQSLSALVGGIAGAAALLISLTVLSPVLALIVAISGVPLWWLARRSGSVEFDFAVSQTVNVRERMYLQDLLSRREGAAEARAYATSHRLRQRFGELYDDFLTATRALVRRRYLLAGSSAIASAAAATLAMALLFVFIRRGAMNVSEAASGLVAIRLLSARLGLLFGGVSTLFQSSLFLHYYDVFLSERQGALGIAAGDPPPTMGAGAASPAAPEDPGARRSPTAGVRLQHVDFWYPSGTAAAVSGVTLDIPPGQVVALVGENGSGKTTLAKLIAGLYEPAAGTLSWHTAQGAEVDRPTAQRDITLVLQEFARYQFSLRTNIELGRPDAAADDEAVATAARAAGLDEVVASLPAGYDTRLSRQFDGGRDLSLGQWQRVALARAFYRRGSLVVFDEPAASLDPRAERRLYDSVRELLHGRTVILITHRMQSVRTADRIIVMARGAVVEDGDHATLMRAGGLYAELVTLQETSGLQRAESDPLPPDPVPSDPSTSG